MKDPLDIKNALPQFIGTVQWHRYSPLFPNVLLTDGAKFVADECEAYWLMDAICSYLPSLSKRQESFTVVLLEVSESKAVLTLNDDLPARTVYAKQEIEFTDFPLDEIKLYAVNDGKYWVILLPSEY